MMEELLLWLQHSEGPLAYVVLSASSFVEYLFPPFPGDTIALFGIFLAATAGYHVVWVYVALNLGAFVGGMATYGVGRWIGVRREQRTPRFLRGKRARIAIDTTIERFDRHGALYLAINRFVPALRGFFFVAAGMAGLPWWRVALFGTLSAMVWNGLLLGLGWLVGANFDELSRWVATYSYVAVGLTVFVVGVLVWRATRSKPPAEEVPPPSGPSSKGVDGRGDGG